MKLSLQEKTINAIPQIPQAHLWCPTIFGKMWKNSKRSTNSTVMNMLSGVRSCGTLTPNRNAPVCTTISLSCWRNKVP
ncbi:tetratricopeptide repeat domain 3 [Rhinolophus ferrumequinum]|uniref:Tetratricopeptide repeat domain 3 n=1 Tax=Rhinolophus ferrumequinum TaxID=59479 RepID=A0A7J8AH64_RHIFE|nr:tetratricopeptide repeat domain 3 [Rhinolophus ferrumequinum]